MARIANVNVSDNKHVIIALQAIYGIGPTRAMKICHSTQVKPQSKLRDLGEETLNALRTEVGKYVVEGDLRREVNMHVKRLLDLGCYRGIRHRRRLPVRGQRTKTNAHTRKRGR